MNKVEIEFFHDVICSFCFPMSYRMRQLKSIIPETEIIHRSFGLVKHENDFIQMFGSREQAKVEIMSHWYNANINDDLHRFNIDGMRQENFPFPTSMKPLWAAKAAYHIGGDEAYWDLFDALQMSFFSINQNIALNEVIYDNVKQIGLNFEKWNEYFASDKAKEEVEIDFQIAEKYGLRSVPALVINGESILRGAVSLDQIKNAVENANHKTNTLLQ